MVKHTSTAPTLRGASVILALLAAGCPDPTATRCSEHAQCPRGYICDEGSGLCLRSPPSLDATPADRIGGEAGPPDAAPRESTIEGPPVDAAVAEAAMLDRRPADRIAIDGPDATQHLDAAAPDRGADDQSPADSAQPDLVGFDAAALVCGSSFGFTPEPPVAGEPLEVHYYSSFRYASLDLMLSGAGDPVVVEELVYDFGTTFTFVFKLSTVQAGVLHMTLASGAIGVDACARLVPSF